MATYNKILLTVYTDGAKLAQTEMDRRTFTSESGVLRLLDIDPDSRVEIHKRNGDVITYQNIL